METTKRLYRSTKDRIIGGVCGGIANYFDIDPVIIRLLCVLFFFVSGWGLLAYIIGWIVIQKECIIETTEPEPKVEPESETKE